MAWDEPPLLAYLSQWLLMDVKEDMNRPKAEKRAGDKASIVYDQLRASILSGELASGTPVSQESIAKSIGVSRGPVREAMRRLQQDQLVVARANQGFIIAPFNVSDLEVVLSLHLSIIALGIRVGVPFLTDQEAQSLESDADAMRQALEQNKIDKWEYIYRRFVLTLIKHTGTRTVNLVSQLIDDIGRYRANLNEDLPPIWQSKGKEFRQIALAARERDGERASVLYVEYTGRLSLLILAGASPLHDAVKLRSYLSQLSDQPGELERSSREVRARPLVRISRSRP